MIFYQRFAYYLVGLIIGCFFVAMVLSGKDTRCNYFPNARVLNDLSTKPFNLSPEASKKLDEKWVTMVDIKNTLKYGDVDFEQVAPKCSWITPVPGGVGLLTIIGLLKNTLAAANKTIYA